MNKYLLFISVFVFLFSNPVHGQKDSSLTSGLTNTQTKLRPKATLKINPTCIIDIMHPSLFISSDIWLAKHWVTEIGAGWFFASVARSHKGEWLNGFRGRLGLKYVFRDEKKLMPFVGLEGKYNFIREKSIIEICRYGCQYQQLMLILKETQTIGAAVRGGIHILAGKKKNFILDIYSGLGFKFTRIHMLLPEEAELIPTRQFITLSTNRVPGNYTLADFLFGVNLGYCFH